MFPINILPGMAGKIVQAVPLQYLAYFPAAVFLGKLPGEAMWLGLTIQAAWVLFFMLASRAAWHFGLRRYSGFGG
jgi:ABC-2 type transport system permease protein